MAAITKHPRAGEDLSEISDYIADDSVTGAMPRRMPRAAPASKMIAPFLAKARKCSSAALGEAKPQSTEGAK